MCTWKTDIENLLQENHASLWREIQNMQAAGLGLCALRNVNYLHHGHPCYTDPAQRSLYLLRYGPAYATEYRVAFEKMLEDGILAHKQPVEPPVVLSIGCGAALDKLALHHALRHCLPAAPAFIYLAVDVADWGYDACPRVHHTLTNVSMGELPACSFSEKVNVIAFPKSLPEIDDDVLAAFIDNIDDIFGKRLCVIASNRDSDDDAGKADAFCCALMQKFKFKGVGGATLPAEDRKIWDVYERFSQSAAIDLVTNLHSHCTKPASSAVANCAECEEILNRWPIVTTKYFNTTLHYLSRT